MKTTAALLIALMGFVGSVAWAAQDVFQPVACHEILA